jgi:hypothetical protein
VDHVRDHRNDRLSDADQAVVATGEQRSVASRARRIDKQAVRRAFLALDRLILDGVSAGAIRSLPREELHCTLVIALSEAATRAATEPSADWVADAAALFLAGVAA